MKQIQLKQVGSFIKTHGFQGNLVLNIDEGVTSDLLDKSILEKEAVFVEIDGIPVPFFISENGIRQLNVNTLMLSLDDVDNEKAKELCNCGVFINVFYLDNVKNEDDNFDLQSLIGYLVKDVKLGEIGKVKTFVDLKENPLLSIDHKGNEILLPLLADFILSIDNTAQSIATDLPDGYLDALK